MIRLFALLLVILPFTASAKDLPAFYRVSNVSESDTLNVRAGPSVSEDKIGTLASNQSNIEVVRFSDDGKWAQINLNEQAGWAALAYLERTGPSAGPDTPLACLGNEPFWSLDLTAGNAVTFVLAGEEGQTQTIQSRTTAAGVIGRYGVVTQSMQAIFTNQLCSDGMSDRSYGIEVDLLRKDANGWMQMTGCCSMVAN